MEDFIIKAQTVIRSEITYILVWMLVIVVLRPRDIISVTQVGNTNTGI